MSDHSPPRLTVPPADPDRGGRDVQPREDGGEQEAGEQGPAPGEANRTVHLRERVAELLDNATLFDDPGAYQAGVLDAVQALHDGDGGSADGTGTPPAPLTERSRAPRRGRPRPPRG